MANLGFHPFIGFSGELTVYFGTFPPPVPLESPMVSSLKRSPERSPYQGQLWSTLGGGRDCRGFGKTNAFATALAFSQGWACPGGFEKHLRAS